jgi:hypothetical protein
LSLVRLRWERGAMEIIRQTERRAHAKTQGQGSILVFLA